MSRRAALPGADELFRATSAAAALTEVGADQPTPAPAAATEPAAARPPLRRVGADSVAPSGRERHDQKITVYLSADELVALDEAKSALFRDHQLKVDRGRIVREAMAVVLADLAAKGDHGILVRRLRER
ncbi:MAG: hypothetical protein OEV62_11840 [Actinomycetota bacterium]|nr:hypothetical protein [Actinomycetota bacterium]MDH4353317.1 hypothetical protein [Actinomycetota bacterium]MDH5278430.1 hypothetical protein [Actinomycetota bacterium]